MLLYLKLGYCNSVLYNVPKYVLKKLQSVENAAARLITCSRKYDHITTVLSDLHWLPVNERITIPDPARHPQGSTPTSTHLRSRFANWLYLPPRNLRSSCLLRMNPVNFNIKSCRSRAFAVATPDLWNSLPDNILSCDNYSFF